MSDLEAVRKYHDLTSEAVESRITTFRFLTAAQDAIADLEEEQLHLARELFSHTMGFPLVHDMPEEKWMEWTGVVIDALAWNYVTEGGDIGKQVAYFEMWNVHKEIEEEVLAIVERYEERG